jgi:hypothetical protein
LVDVLGRFVAWMIVAVWAIAVEKAIPAEIISAAIRN